MKEEWKKQMQQKMADYRESDIEVSWEEIEKALAANRKQARARVVPMRMRGIAAAVVVLLLAGGGYYWMQQEEREVASPSNAAFASEKVAASASASKEVPAPQSDIASASEDGGASASEKAFSPVHKFVTQAIAAVKAEAEAAQTAIAPETNETQMPQDFVAQSQEAESQTEEAESQPQKVETQVSTAQHREVTTQQLPPLYPSDLRKSHSSQSRLTAKVYLSNTMASMSSGSQFDDINKLQYGYGPASKSQNEGGGYNGDISDKNQKPNENPFVPANLVNSGELVDHHQPIRFGFSLRYRLDNRWSIESGLTYTRLSADITYTVNGQKSESEQRLNYIGIPLSASYQLWGSRYFNFYLSAGGLVEKMVKGSRTTQGTTNSVSIRPLQLSVNGAVGAEFKFIDNLSLYAEPSLNYYFDNGSAVPTFYQDKPLNFNLNVGLRFNIK